MIVGLEELPVQYPLPIDFQFARRHMRTRYLENHLRLKLQIYPRNHTHNFKTIHIQILIALGSPIISNSFYCPCPKLGANTLLLPFVGLLLIMLLSLHQANSLNPTTSFFIRHVLAPISTNPLKTDSNLTLTWFLPLEPCYLISTVPFAIFKIALSVFLLENPNSFSTALLKPIPRASIPIPTEFHLF